ncbi:DUF924 family protein [Advenella alkanexedens]|uniref:DUF924 family protein n=1 Tax=Advenella alkanexedens TaxID=1481665 RepID=UPI0016B6408B|nr:DUF924 family protein [Advenella alkanexedens]NLY34747.1 DUF924 domain-containing protein [Alcaligenaceae bacterium]WKU19622.1 DUF924 family protein [Advenella alkanexedens]
MQTTPQDILHFWFVESTPQMWFQSNKDYDLAIRERFGQVCEAAARGECDSWRDTIQGRLAEIIVLDQFSRNIWRDTPRAFSQDGMALVLAQEAIKLPEYQGLSIMERKFIIMPFMHSESRVIHEKALVLFTELGDPATLAHEIQHKAMIDRFGRYPTRNKSMGRLSTEEEIVFCKDLQDTVNSIVENAIAAKDQV